MLMMMACFEWGKAKNAWAISLINYYCVELESRFNWHGQFVGPQPKNAPRQRFDIIMSRIKNKYVETNLIWSPSEFRKAALFSLLSSIDLTIVGERMAIPELRDDSYICGFTMLFRPNEQSNKCKPIYFQFILSHFSSHRIHLWF